MNVYRLIMLAVVLMTLGTFCHAKAPDEQEAIDCATKRCANTPIGEDPETLQLRVGKHMQDDFRRDPNDAKRWSSVIIFSKSAHKDNLTMPIITSSNLRMTLNPDKGILQFSSPAATQSFKIASPLPHKQNELCPKYQLRVLDGTPDYALIEKACPMREYEPRRFFRSTTYYIYDMKSATMREIWMGARGFDTISPFPSAEPQIVLKKIKDGYQFDWQGMSADDAPPILVRIHRAYKREHDRQGNVGLVCYDTTKPQHPLKENESCESEILERVLP